MFASNPSPNTVNELDRHAYSTFPRTSYNVKTKASDLISEVTKKIQTHRTESNTALNMPAHGRARVPVPSQRQHLPSLRSGGLDTTT